MWRAEQEHGSLIKGMMKSRSKSAKKNFHPRVISFPDGLSELTTSLHISLGQHLRLHNGALKIGRTQNGYIATTSTGVFESKKIIIALPAYDVAPILRSLASDLSNTLGGIYYPPVAIVYLGYRNDQFSQIPEGFGGLIPSKENRKILGIIYSSSNFPNRAPEGRQLLTVLIGGAQKLESKDWTNDRIIEVATNEVSDLLNPQGKPEFQHLRIWNNAIPQYNVGYGAVLDAIDRTEAENPGMHFIGNYRNGISMGACIKNATELAKRLV
jgi:oxygen-dependent protoporphyrinogen oxidase